MTFKGIVLNNNPYDVDQLSLKDAKNVYVDDNGTLISRPPIVIEPLPTVYSIVNGISYPVPILTENYILVDMIETGKVTVYVCKNTNGEEYEIVAVNKSNLEQTRYEGITSYRLSVFEQYIILFNNENTVVLNVNEFSSSWRPIREFAEVPITKRVVGQESFTYPKNQFTEDYKEEYVMSADVLSIIPSGTAEVEVTQTPTNLKWTLPNANINPEFRILRSVGITIQSSDLITTATNINTGINVLAIARYDQVLISLDYGQSFERVLYPSHDEFSQVASVSKDGLQFFFVAKDGVYRYTIGTKQWVVIRLIDIIPEEPVQLTLNGIGINNACSFLNDEVFTFSLYHLDSSISKVDLYWKGPGLRSDNFAENTLGRTTLEDIIDPNTKTTKSAVDCVSMSISVDDVGTEAVPVLLTNILAWLPSLTVETSTFIIITAKTDVTNFSPYIITLDKKYGSIEEFEVLNRTGITVDIVATVTTVEHNQWYKATLEAGYTSSLYSDFWYSTLIADANDLGAPINLELAYITNKLVSSLDGSASLPIELDGAIRNITISAGTYFYTVLDNILYTNKLTTDNTASLVFTRTTNTPYTNVPTLSYSESQLFLGFGNTLMITDNKRDGDNLYLNLPIINNHSFSSDINGLLNISTTEIAAFLIDKVYIIMKVADDLLGYRYDYLTTRLSTGVRAGDSVMNTMDGKLTLYPTVRGLAVMNYQADVASTEQVVDYVTNNIRAIWNDFYLAGCIKMVQMKDYVYLSNGTTTYLMLDLRNLSWWSLVSPFVITKIVTDQLKFNIISNGLYQYDFNHTIYKDVLTRNIDWEVESQPNHFNAPTYYKNLKQLIFQLEESTNVDQTLSVQIILYRKHFALKDLEAISFKIEAYKTYVKRFNYWKINEMQWALESDSDNANPAQLRLNGISIKYEISEEVRS